MWVLEWINDWNRTTGTHWRASFVVHRKRIENVSSNTTLKSLKKNQKISLCDSSSAALWLACSNETKKLFIMAERVFEPRVCTFTRAARAPLDWGSSHSSPGVSIDPVASDANAAGAGSAGRTRLSSRQVLSRLYSISTRQWRFLELYSTRLINRPKPWCAEYKRKRRTKGHRDWWKYCE